MANWKKVLREDYAVGITDGLINLQAAQIQNTDTVQLQLLDYRRQDYDPSTGGSNTTAMTAGLGLALVNFAYATSAFNVSVTNLSAGEVTATIDLATAASIVGNNSGASAVSLQFGDDINFTSDSVAIVATESAGSVSIDIEVPTLYLAGDTSATGAFNFDQDGSAAANTLAVTGATNSGIEVVASSAGWEIDLTDFTIAGNDAAGDDYAAGSGTARTKSPAGNITFGSSDDSVGVNVTGGGDAGETVSIDLKAKGTVTDIDQATSSSTIYNLVLTDANSDGAYDAYIDNDLLKWTVTSDGSDTESAVLTVGGDTIIAGDLTVQGDTTTLNTQTVTSEDQLIVLGLPSSAWGSDAAAVTGVDGGGIVLASTADVTGVANTNEGARLVWSSSAKLSGWTAANTGTSTNDSAAHEVSIMDFGTSAPSPSAEAAGAGSFFFDTTNKLLYIDIA